MGSFSPTHSTRLKTHLPFLGGLAGTNLSVLEPEPTEGARGAPVAALAFGLSFGLSFGRDFALPSWAGALCPAEEGKPGLGWGCWSRGAQIHKSSVHFCPWLAENNFQSYRLQRKSSQSVFAGISRCSLLRISCCFTPCPPSKLLGASILDLSWSCPQ